MRTLHYRLLVCMSIFIELSTSIEFNAYNIHYNNNLSVHGIYMISTHFTCANCTTNISGLVQVGTAIDTEIWMVCCGALEKPHCAPGWMDEHAKNTLCTKSCIRKMSCGIPALLCEGECDYVNLCGVEHINTFNQ